MVQKLLAAPRRPARSRVSRGFRSVPSRSGRSRPAPREAIEYLYPETDTGLRLIVAEKKNVSTAGKTGNLRSS